MLPRKLHVDEINRFHDKFKGLNEKIDAETDETKKLELYRVYFQMTKLWSKIDDFIEMGVKLPLDCLDSGDVKEFLRK